MNYAGKLYTSPMREHEIFCATCPESSVYHAPTKREAEREFRTVGNWKRIRGLWHCPSCVMVMERERN